MLSSDFSKHPDRVTFEFRAYATRVIDGDTLEVMVDCGFSVYHTLKVRIYGVNTPELDAKDDDVRIAARMAKQYLEGLVKDVPLRIVTHKTAADSYKQTFARYVAMVWAYRDDKWQNVGELVKASGYSK